MNRIFISYRREDTLVYVDRLQEDIAGHFGPDEVFRDMDTIEPGSDCRGDRRRARRDRGDAGASSARNGSARRGAGDCTRPATTCGRRSPRACGARASASSRCSSAGRGCPPVRTSPGDISSLTRRNAFDDRHALAGRSLQLFRRLDAMLAEEEAARRDDGGGEQSRAGAKDETRRGLRTPAIDRRSHPRRRGRRSPPCRSPQGFRPGIGAADRAGERARRRLRTRRRRACSSGSLRTPRASAGRTTSR